MNRLFMGTVVVLATAVGSARLASAAGPVAPEELHALGARLLALREDVEARGRELEETRGRLQPEIDLLTQRRTELELQLSRERLKSEQLTRKSEAIRSRISGATDRGSKAEFQLLRVWAQDLKRSIQESLPFRKQARLEAAERLLKRVEEGRDSPISVASELWNLTEDELKLARENEYRVVQLQWSDRSVDAEVARFGSVQMVFVTADGVAGKALRSGAGWTLERASGADEEKAIRRTLAQFRERRKSGWFEIPGLASLADVSELKVGGR